LTASRIPFDNTSFTAPVIDYEPPPVAPTCPPPTPAALHRRTPRRLIPVARPPVREAPPPRAAAVFADAALRRVLEVIDRRRPVAQLRPLLAPPLIDTVVSLGRAPHTAAATLRRVRLRVVDGDGEAAEVFASYSRGDRVHAIAGRVEFVARANRWQIVALQIG
jgi:Family of unknown function (DUF6459)